MMAGLFAFIGCLFSETARHNRDLYKLKYADKSKVIYTSIRPDKGEDKMTASGYAERSRPADGFPEPMWDDTDHD